jgi:N-methylhydantoinase A
MSFDGPAIVETRGTTVVVRPGDELAVDDYGNMIISITLDNEDGEE